MINEPFANPLIQLEAKGTVALTPERKGGRCDYSINNEESREHMFPALLFRLNPKLWPTWKEDILNGYEPVIDIGRRKRDELGRDIPIIALGTEGLGFVAIGKTVSEVEDCDDPQWEDVPLGDQEKFRQIRPRIRARFELVNPNSDFRENEMISLLINRRQTLNPISLDEYEEFAGLVGL